MRVVFSLILLFYSFTLYGQKITESEISKIAKQVEEKLRGQDLGGMTIRNCFSYGRTIVYQYNVPSYWRPPDNIKEELIQNLKTIGTAKTYFFNSINVDFCYFKGNKIVKRVGIKSHEFVPSELDVGKYISIKDHKKSKGVNLKLKAPKGWDVNEGDRPRIVKKFVRESNTFVIGVNDNVTFFSRKEIKELLSDQKYVDDFIRESFPKSKNNVVLAQSVVTVDSYPAISFKVRRKAERAGITFTLLLRGWLVFYEDKIILFQMGGLDNPEFKALDLLSYKIINSVIFPDRHN